MQTSFDGSVGEGHYVVFGLLAQTLPEVLGLLFEGLVGLEIVQLEYDSLLGLALALVAWGFAWEV